MSSLDHRSASRRWTSQHSQQDLPSSHSVHTAHLNLGRAYSFERESTRRSTTTLKNGTRSRTSSRLLRTLKDAFEATSRTAAMDPNEPTAMPDRTPSPSSRRQRNSMLPSPLAAVTSPPPGELLETYQRINDADDLADLVSEDDLDIEPPEVLSRRSSKERRRRRESPGSLSLRYAQGEDRNDNLGPALSYLDDVTDDYPRGTLSTYKRDEERLSRVTTSQSPVFSKAKVGSKSDNLQRRESDPPTTEEARDFLGEEDGLRLGLNVPKSWGNRSKNHRQWLSSFTQPQGETAGRLTERERRTRVESRSRSPRLSNTSPSRNSGEFRDGSEQRSERSRLGAPPSDGLHNHSRSRSRSFGRGGLTGDAIPNTPVTIYKSTSRDRTYKTRNDSRDLLRKLARTESPNQHSTPEQKQPAETSLPEKTPVVIGAWVDTPMTVRNPDANGEDETKEIDSPSKPTSKSTVVPILRPSGSDSESKNESADLTKSEAHSRNASAHTRNASATSDVPSGKSIDGDSEEKKPHTELIKPKIPKSALEGILEDAKSSADPLALDLGDDTINSLQGIVNNSDPSSSSFMKMKEEPVMKELDDAIESDIDRERKPKQLLDHMGSKLQSIIYSIRDARTGLNDLHDVLTSGNGNETIHIKCCETCGTPQHDGRIYVAIPIPRLWRRDRVSGRLRPTYLGWFIVIFGCWYVSESTMCDYYCHPTIAEVCDGYCLQPDAPRFPFTLPTMLWRWSHLSSILSPIITILIAFFRLIAQVLGVWDGYVDENYLSDFQPFPSSSSSFNDLPVGGNPERESRNGGLFGLWPGGRVDKAATLTSTTSAAAISSMPPILQKVIEDPPPHVVVDDSMDGDEILQPRHF